MHGPNHLSFFQRRHTGGVRVGRRVGLGVLAAALLLPLSGLASAHGRAQRATGHPRAAGRPAVSTVKPPSNIVQNDLSLTGTVAQGTSRNVLELSLDGSVPIREVITAKTTFMVGPYAVGADFLTPGTAVQTWTHIAPNGDIVADYVSLRPTVVQGTRTAGALGQDGNGNNTLTVNTSNGPVTVVVVPDATVIHIIPPWDHSLGLSVTTQVAAVGVMLPDGDLLAAEVLGISAASSNS